MEKQRRVIAAQHQKEREDSVVILGVPDQNEALDGATTDQDKLGVIWNKFGIDGSPRNAPQVGTRGQ